MLDGSIMLNLDTEDDDELTIGCAGGVDVTATGKYAQESPKNKIALKLVVKAFNRRTFREWIFTEEEEMQIRL